MSASWSEGYVTEIDYTSNTYPQMSPSAARFQLLNQRIHFPKVQNYCELGFGQGLTLNLLGAASPHINFWGTDFSPSHTANAQAMAEKIGSNVHAFDQSFEAFCTRDDLPQFEMIALHGIWSWISPENQDIIRQFIVRKLAPGGVVYISYNTLAGWTNMAPAQNVLRLLVQRMGSANDGVLDNIKKTQDSFMDILSVESAFAKANPLVKNHFEKVFKDHNSHYIAHEYLNGSWNLTSFSELAKELEDVKLNFACSADFFVPNFNLTKEQIEIVEKYKDPIIKETLIDFFGRQTFRRDYWTRGIRKMTPQEQKAEYGKMSFVLTSLRDAIKLEVPCKLGTMQLPEKTFKPLLDLLSDHKPHRLQEIIEKCTKYDIKSDVVLGHLYILNSLNHLMTLFDDEAEIPGRAASIARFNTYQLERMSSHALLAVPSVGTSITLDHINALLLRYFMQGCRTEKDLAKNIWRTFASQGKNLIHEGKTLKTAEENLKHLEKVASVFLKQHSKFFQNLGFTAVEESFSLVRSDALLVRKDKEPAVG